MASGPGIQIGSQAYIKAHILPYDMNLQELTENSWTIRNPCTTHHANNFQTVSVLTPGIPRFHAGTSDSTIPIPITFNPHPAITVDDEPNSKSWKYSTQRLTTAVVPATIVSCTLDRV